MLKMIRKLIDAITMVQKDYRAFVQAEDELEKRNRLPFGFGLKDNVEILQATEKAIDEYGTLFGFDVIGLSPKHVEALQRGKMLAWNDGEYSTFVVLRGK